MSLSMVIEHRRIPIYLIVRLGFFLDLEVSTVGN